MEAGTGNLETGLSESMVMDVRDSAKPDLVNLQMVLVTSSMNHEYVRKAYERTRSFDKKQNLIERMANLKDLYYTARKKLAVCYPDRLASIEAELLHQKQSVLSEETVH